MDNEEKVEQKNKNFKTTVIGISIIFFCFIGIITTVKYIYVGTIWVVQNIGEKEKLERYILPVLMFDPVPFDDIKDADQLSLLQSAIWDALISNNKEKYTDEENRQFIVPASDVDVSIKKLYGSTVNIKHQTFGDGYMNNYLYEDSTKQYVVPILDQVGQYSPKIEKIKKEGNTYILTAGYIRPIDIWQMYMSRNNKKPKPEKYMDYTIEKSQNGFKILAIKDSDMKVKALQE